MFIFPLDSISETKKNLTTKFNEVNVRNGPGLNHLKIYKILKKGYPLKVIKEFESWKKVKDFKGVLGWVSNSQLSDKAFGIVIIDEEVIFKFPELKSKKIARIKKNFVIRIKKCSADWCFVEEGEIKGWISKKSFWGFKN
tara:strand:+ start:313 stop:732 length:420 start_codon:yes stop_codon:yes gene_type:complete